MSLSERGNLSKYERDEGGNVRDALGRNRFSAGEGNTNLKNHEQEQLT